MNWPRFAKSGVERLFSITRRVHTPNSVLLTFDDGPHPEVTPQVLERLSRFNARAVFFLVGSRIPRASDLPAQIHAAGHVLGNHTFAHRLDRDPPPLSYLRDVRKCQDEIEQLTGERPRLFRAPMGGGSVGALLAPRLLGLHHILWSIDEQDWMLHTEKQARQCAERLRRRVSAGDIVLLHDEKPWVLTVLDILLPHLVSCGYDLANAVDAL